MSLQNWLSNGWLVEQRTNAREISDLLSVAERDIVDSQTPGLSPDWRLNIAYNAVLQAATAALAAAGYRASREAHHYRVIQSLAYTIKADQGLIRQLDAFRKKRNVGEYEIVGAVSDLEAGEMVSLAMKLLSDVRVWLRDHYPEFLSE